MLVPHLQDRGIQIETAAYYPWKSLEGDPMLDSCAIFILKRPGRYKLDTTLEMIHDRDESGFLRKAESICRGGDLCSSGGDEHGWHRHSSNQGPGQRLSAYLPKDVDPYRKLEMSIAPSNAS